MIISQMHLEFKFRLDKLDALNYPNFEPEEIDLILNQAQQELIKERYSGNNFLRNSFEETQKRTEDLKMLIRDVTLLPWLTLKENVTLNSVFFPLPEDHWFIVQERAIINGPKCNSNLYIDVVPARCIPNPQDENEEICYPITEVVVVGKYCEVRPIQHLEVSKLINDPFKGPDYNKVLRLMYIDRVEIIPSNIHTVVRYKMRYIKKPQEMSITTPTNCELSEHLHDELINKAVDIALEGIESKRQETFQRVKNSEE